MQQAFGLLLARETVKILLHWGILNYITNCSTEKLVNKQCHIFFC